MDFVMTGKSCTLVLVHWPRGVNPKQNRHGGVTLLKGFIQTADRVIRLMPTGGSDPVLIPPHLVDKIEEVTDELRAGLEIDLDTELCLRAYYDGRATLKTLGRHAVLAESSGASKAE